MLTKADRGPTSYHCRVYVWQLQDGRWKYAIVTSGHRIYPNDPHSTEALALRAAQIFINRTNMDVSAIVKGKWA